MIKAAFFDVDGTLLSHKTKRIPDSAIAALEKLQRKGICCIVSTGRQIGAYPQAHFPIVGCGLVHEDPTYLRGKVDEATSLTSLKLLPSSDFTDSVTARVFQSP